MRKILARAIDRLVRPLGLACRSRKDLQRQEALQRALTELVNDDSSTGPATVPSPLVTGVIFSKDRACQLHALLESFHAKVAGEIPLRILFTASSARHLQAYEDVRALFAGRAVIWIQESDFRRDLLQIMEQLSSHRVLFLVDDIVMTRAVDFERLRPFSPKQCVVSLRLGEHITRHHRQPMPPPALRPTRVNDQFLEWNWDQGELSWAYPLSVDGHLFSTGEMRVMAGQVEFTGPNSFEKALQLFRPVFSRRLGICFRQSRLVNLPVNIVQTERENLHGNVEPEFLLEKWEAGQKMDLANLYEWTNQSLHQEQPLNFIPR